MLAPVLLHHPQQMTSLPDYNKITFPDMPGIPFEEVVPEASDEVDACTYTTQI